MNRKGLIARGIAVIVLICLLTGFTAYVLRRNDGYAKNQEFYDSDEEYDVLFFGSSHAVMGVLPMELWHNYGMTSYNLANNGQMIPTDYWVLRSALERKKPSLVVMDVYTLYADEKYAVMEYAHGSIDPMPLSKTKIDAIYDIFPQENRFEFLLPFSIYHNRWDTVTAQFFDRSLSAQKGAFENNAQGTPFVEPVQKIKMTVDEYAETPETTNKEYLRRSIELCQENDIPILLVAAPFNDHDYLTEWTNGARQLAKEYDIPFLNGLEADLIQTNCDLYDRGHLNSSGARKWTDYLGQYISENYAIADKREDAAYSAWNEDYEAYRAYKIEELNSVEELYPLLMLLNDEEWSVCITLKKGSALFKDNWFWELMANAGEVTKTADNTQSYFCLIDNKAGTVSELFGTSEAASVPSAFGTFAYEVDAHGMAQISLADQLLVPQEGSSAQNGLQIWVFDHDTGALVRYAAF